MPPNRILLLIAVACGASLVGCASPSEPAVDKPLMTNAPPPPERPNKPSVSPNGPGGAPKAGASSL